MTRLEFIERELRKEIRQLRSWAKEDEAAAHKTYGEDGDHYIAKADAYLHSARQMERILNGKTAAEDLRDQLLK